MSINSSPNIKNGYNQNQQYNNYIPNDYPNHNYNQNIFNPISPNNQGYNLRNVSPINQNQFNSSGEKLRRVASNMIS